MADICVCGARERLEALENELRAALDAGESVRVREGGGPEDLAASVAVTLARLRASAVAQSRPEVKESTISPALQQAVARLRHIVQDPVGSKEQLIDVVRDLSAGLGACEHGQPWSGHCQACGYPYGR